MSKFRNRTATLEENWNFDIKLDTIEAMEHWKQAEMWKNRIGLHFIPATSARRSLRRQETPAPNSWNVWAV